MERNARALALQKGTPETKKPLTLCLFWCRHRGLAEVEANKSRHHDVLSKSRDVALDEVIYRNVWVANVWLLHQDLFYYDHF